MNQLIKIEISKTSFAYFTEQCPNHSLISLSKIMRNRQHTILLDNQNTSNIKILSSELKSMALFCPSFKQLCYYRNATFPVHSKNECKIHERNISRISYAE